MAARRRSSSEQTDATTRMSEQRKSRVVFEDELDESQFQLVEATSKMSAGVSFFCYFLSHYFDIWLFSSPPPFDFSEIQSIKIYLR